MWQLQPGIMSRAALDGAAGIPLSIGGTPVTTATVGAAYAGFTVTAAGGTSPYTYSVASGSLPAGITLNSSSGAVSGTPTTAGAYASIVIRATDAVSATANLAAFTITVSAAVSSEVSAFLARTSGLDTTHTNAYTALIDGLVADGVWSKLDVLHVYATQDSTTALLNLVSASYNGTANGSPTFTADRGFTGVNGSSTVYINTNFNPNTASSPKYVRNSAHLSAWSLFTGTSTNPVIGMNDASSFNFIYTKYTDTNSYCVVNGSTNAGLKYNSNPSANAFWIATRVDASSTVLYRNATSVTLIGSSTSAPVANANVYVLSQNNNGTASGTAEQVTMASIGSSLSSTDATNLYNRLRTYLTAVGVP